MPSRIRVLDDLTINKIAAGEVIENPSSVVKELVENCLDAGACEITVEAHAGGRHLIRITDNGVGMGRDDALLALERHATSKLNHIDDLTRLTSLGFRGEAVPSIASISKFSILTSEGGQGTYVRVEGGKIYDVSDAPRQKGTTIEVKEIFYNLPVRKKFLKSPAADETSILKGFMEQCLARPEIKFQLILNQKSTLLVHPEEPDSRIASVLGNNLKKELLPLAGNQLRGYIGTPASARPNRSMQYLFLNGRPIQSQFISWSIKEAYSTHLQPRRFPIFVLWLTLDPEMFDVNVHPQKREVRFRDEGHLQQLVFKSVHQALSAGRESLHYPSTFEAIPTVAPPTWESLLKAPDAGEPDEINRKNNINNVSLSEGNFDIFFPEPERMPVSRVAATLKGYILAEVPGKEGVQLIDQQRAHARVLFEKLQKNEPLKLSREALLIPLTFELSKIDSRLLKDHLPELNVLGFEIREFGPQTFLLEAYPSSYNTTSVESLIHSFIDDIKEETSARTDPLKLKCRLAEKSSRMSITTKSLLSHEEAQHLVQELWKCDQPWESPQGKPTIVHLDGEILGKHFT